MTQRDQKRYLHSVPLVTLRENVLSDQEDIPREAD